MVLANSRCERNKKLETRRKRSLFLIIKINMQQLTFRHSGTQLWYQLVIIGESLFHHLPLMTIFSIFTKVVNSATGANLFSALATSLYNDGVGFTKLVGFGSDNANNMVGQNNSVWSRIREAQPNAYLSGCVCHIAATVCSDACNSLPDSLEQLAVNLFTYFYQSSVR